LGFSSDCPSHLLPNVPRRFQLCTLVQHPVNTMPSRPLTIVLVAAFLFTNSVAFTQEGGASPKHPKIGLVLEGGGALGLAHIGVLMWLEEHRIPISYVAGTSMGGLVGGIYATGDSPAEIRDLVIGIDWNYVLRGQIPFRDLSYRRKEDAVEYPNSLEFGIKHGIKFPEGFNSGHQVGLLLDRISLPYSEMKSFSDLPIPFACVATDLVSGKKHVFHDGSMSVALRSTMSLPGIFNPVRTSESVFVDGGLLDNLPVDVAKDMGAELVIAVDLQDKQLEPTKPLSSFGVLGQSISVVITANELRSMQRADILISVPLTEFTSMDYRKDNAIIQKGYEAAASKGAVLSAFSIDESSWKDYLAQRHARRRTIPNPQFVEVIGTKPALAKEIEHKLSGDLDKPVDTASLDRKLTYLAGIGRFSRLGYRMIEKDNQQGLLILADEKPYGPPIVRPLIFIDGSEYNNVQFTMGARITFFDLGSFGTEWRNDVSLGSQYGVKSEYYRPFGTTLRWFVAPRVFATNTRAEYYSGGTLVADYRNRQAGAAFDVGYTFSRLSELRVGYDSAYQKFSPLIGAATFGTLQGRVGITSLRYNFIQRDDPVVPRRGYDVHFRTEWYDANPGAHSGFPVTEMEMTLFKPVKKPSSVFFGANGGTTFTYHQIGVPPFSLGGNQNLVAYGTNEFLTDQYFQFKAGYIHQLLELSPIIGDKLYAIAGYEVAKVYGIPNVSSLPTDAFGGLIVNTIFGPILAGGAYGATGHHKFFFRMGRIF
jgi:NTE family protein